VELRGTGLDHAPWAHGVDEEVLPIPVSGQRRTLGASSALPTARLSSRRTDCSGDRSRYRRKPIEAVEGSQAL
jgi:hypothetical protein